jgi:SAM-dependent methyltransferase
MLRTLFKRITGKISQKITDNIPYPSWVAYEPNLVPPPPLMRMEGIYVMEEWFRWAEEWSFLLRLFGKITSKSKILEIGCGLGRIAFPLRYILSAEGSYDGFEICEEKVKFLNSTYKSTHPNFRFIWADVHNTYYNPHGQIEAKDYVFPYADNSFDLVFAASVFTHMLPDAAENYFKEAARVLKPNGRIVFSCFILDNYDPKQPRPLGFARPGFNFDYPYSSYGENFAISNPNNAEEMTAYRIKYFEKLVSLANLEMEECVNGLWSGKNSNWISTQDLIIMTKKD